MIRIWVLYILIPLLFTTLRAQTNELDNQFSPPPKSVFDINPLHMSGNSNDGADRKNFIKLMPTMLARQRVVALFEREVFSNFSAYIGLGKAFGDDVFQKAFLQLFSSFGFDNKRLYPDEILTNSKFNKSSPLLMLGVRTYFGETTFRDGFFDFNYRYEKVGYMLEEDFISRNNYISSDKIINFRMHAINLGYGYSTVLGDKNNFSSEFFFSVGMKYFMFDEIRIAERTLPGYIGTQTYTEKSGKFSIARIIPSINIGYCFGFGF
jgi:hypothetical protein